MTTMTDPSNNASSSFIGGDVMSDESDDLETPLQVWRNLIGRFNQEKITDPLSPKHRKGTSDCIVITASRRKSSRLRVSVVESKCTWSSDSENNVDSKRDVGKKTRSSKPRNKKAAAKPRSSKSGHRNASKRRKKAEQTSSSTQIEEDSHEDDFPESKMSSAPRRSKRRAVSSKRRKPLKKNRKNPIQFADDTPPSFNARDEADTGANDSQETVLLDTPHLSDSESTCIDAINDGKCGETSAAQDVELGPATISGGESAPHVPPNSELVAQADSKHNVSNVKAVPTEQSTQAGDADEPTQQDTERLSSPQKAFPSKTYRLAKSEATEIDDLFFGRRDLTCRKPPPRRQAKKSAAVLSASSPPRSSTQESTCSSLWDDDSLWGNK